MIRQMQVGRWLVLAGALAGLALTGCASTTGASGGASHPTGGAAPDFTTTDSDGKTFRLSDHLGKEVVLLDFWATFCEPCKAELPHLKALYKDEKNKGLLIVAVAMDGPETEADVHALVRRFDLGFPVVLDEDSRIASMYNPKKAMPLSVLIGRDGKIAVIREGYNPGDEKLVTADVMRALGAGSGSAASDTGGASGSSSSAE